MPKLTSTPGCRGACARLLPEQALGLGNGAAVARRQREQVQGFGLRRRQFQHLPAERLAFRDAAAPHQCRRLLQFRGLFHVR